MLQQVHQINIQLRNLTDPDYWYQADFLGPNQPAWIYHQPLSLLNDDKLLPRV